MEVALLEEGAVLFRQALYRYCAAGLLYPEPARLMILKDATRWLAASLDGPWPDGVLKERLTTTFEWLDGLDDFPTALQGKWINLFGVSRTSFCYPYEGATIEPQWAGALQASLQHEYAAAGLELSSDELPDHVSVELEYMSYLCGLELRAAAQEAGLRPLIIDRQRAFLSDHLCRWLPGLTERVADASGGVYHDFCVIANELTRQEVSRLERFEVDESARAASANT